MKYLVIFFTVCLIISLCVVPPNEGLALMTLLLGYLSLILVTLMLTFKGTPTQPNQGVEFGVMGVFCMIFFIIVLFTAVIN